jgi:hypothetical protein
MIKSDIIRKCDIKRNACMTIGVLAENAVKHISACRGSVSKRNGNFSVSEKETKLESSTEIINFRQKWSFAVTHFIKKQYTAWPEHCQSWIQHQKTR